MAKKVITLYIDDVSIRLLECRGRRVTKWADLKLKPGLVSDGVITDPAKLADKLKGLLKDRAIKSKKVIAGLSGLHCLCRVITLPDLPRSVLAEAVNREAERQLPVALEELYTSYQIINDSSAEMRVFLVAARRNATDALLKTLQEAGLDTYLMDLTSLALARVVKEATAIIADVRLSEVDIVIMVEGIPEVIRNLPLPIEAASLQGKLPITREELDRTIRFYNSNNPEKPLNPDVPIYVSGELTQEPELCQSLSEELGHPVLPLSSPLKYPKQFDPSRHMVNIGLALKELPLGENAGLSVANLNVLPAAYQPKPVSWSKVVTVPVALTIIGLLVPLVMLTQGASANIASISSQLDMTNQLIIQKQAQKQALMKDIAELEEKLAEAEASHHTFTTALGSLDKQGETVNGDLKATTDNLPSTITLISISHTGGVLTINGTSPNEADILSYARSLDSSGRFSETIIASIKKLEGEGEDEDEGMDFTLILKIRERG
jgi:type IV pilus assembly protein PilM